MEGRAEVYRETQGFYFRLGYSFLNPQLESGDLELLRLEGPARLALRPGALPGHRISARSTWLPLLSFGYRFARWGGGDWSIESALAPPVRLTLIAEGSLAERSLAASALGGIPTGLPALGTELGEASAILPFVLLNYERPISDWAFCYVGAGLAYFMSTGSTLNNPLIDSETATIDVEDSFAFPLQGGLGFPLLAGLSITAELKYFLGIESDAVLQRLRVRLPELPLFSPAELRTARLPVRLAPQLWTLSLAYHR